MNAAVILAPITLFFCTWQAAAQDLSDAEFRDLVCRALTTPAVFTPLWKDIAAAKQARNTATYQAVLEAVVRTEKLRPYKTKDYLREASTLGQSKLFMRTALDLIRAAPYMRKDVFRHVRRYLSRHSDSHVKEQGEFKELLWKGMKKATVIAQVEYLEYLNASEPGKVRAHIEEELKVRREYGERKQYLKLYVQLPGVPKATRLMELKKEFQTANGYLYGISYLPLFRKLISDQVAHRLVRAKFQDEKFQRLSQGELQVAPVSVAFVDTPFSECLTFFRVIVGLDVKIAPSAQAVLEKDAPCSTHIVDTPAVQALTRILSQAELAPRVDGELVVIERGSVPNTTSKKQEAELNRKLDGKVTGAWKDTPIIAVIDFLRSLCKLDIEITPGAYKAIKGKTATWKFDDQPARTVLERALSPHGCGIRFMHGGLEIFFKPKPATN